MELRIVCPRVSLLLRFSLWNLEYTDELFMYCWNALFFTFFLVSVCSCIIYARQCIGLLIKMLYNFDQISFYSTFVCIVTVLLSAPSGDIMLRFKHLYSIQFSCWIKYTFYNKLLGKTNGGDSYASNPDVDCSQIAIII